MFANFDREVLPVVSEGRGARDHGQGPQAKVAGSFATATRMVSAGRGEGEPDVPARIAAASKMRVEKLHDVPCCQNLDA